MQIIPVNSEQIKKSRVYPPVFVLAMLYGDAQKMISFIQPELRSIDSTHIYHLPKNLHVTVKPLGWQRTETTEGKHVLSLVRETVSNLKPFEITFEVSTCSPTWSTSRSEQERPKFEV